MVDHRFCSCWEVSFILHGATILNKVASSKAGVSNTTHSLVNGHNRKLSLLNNNNWLVMAKFIASNKLSNMRPADSLFHHLKPKHRFEFKTSVLSLRYVLIGWKPLTLKSTFFFVFDFFPKVKAFLCKKIAAQIEIECYIFQ